MARNHGVRRYRYPKYRPKCESSLSEARASRSVRPCMHSGFWGTSAMVFPEAGITIAVAVTEQAESRLVNVVMGEVLGLSVCRQLIGAGQAPKESC